MSCTLRTILIIAKRRVVGVRAFASQTAIGSKTIDKHDLDHCIQFADGWWDPKGPVGPLHTLNPVRIQFIRDGLANIGYKEISRSKPLEGLNFLDVGCGGGILTENLARIGANVTGIDVGEELIEVAKIHVVQDKSITDRVNYIVTSIEEHSKTYHNYYDAVVASEVVEHIAAPQLFLKECVKAVKPGGSLFITTENKTYLSLIVYIFLLEYVLRIIPPGTHHWNKFMSPEKVQSILEKYGCQTRLLRGIGYNPFTSAWRFSTSTAITYALHVQKFMN